MHITPEIEGLLENDAVMIATLCKAVYEHYGDSGIAVLRDAMQKKYSRIIPAAARYAGAKMKDGGVEDWVKIESYFGKGMDTVAEFEVTPTRGILHIKTCPFAKQYGKIYPDVCPKVLIGCEEAIAQTVNPKLHARGQKYMTKGEEYCEIVVEFEKGAK